MRLLFDVIVAIALAGWVVATLIVQLNVRFARKISKRDMFHLLPRWTFFAPNPGVTDYHLVFRRQDADGELSSFLELPLHRRSRYAWLFNPDKRTKKALLDLAIMMEQVCNATTDSGGNIRLTFPYVALLNYFSHTTLPPTTRAIQYCLLASQSATEHQPTRLIVCSDFHRVR
jgi:hypothetical protein